MYKTFFGLAKDPFIVSPDPQFLYSTAETNKTYARLLDGIRSRKGLILLVGEVGTGKTLLLRKLIEQLKKEATATAFVFNPRMSAAELVDFVLTDFGFEHDSQDKLRTFKVLQEWLLKRSRMGQTSALIIDESQNLSKEAFEIVHALSNLETPTEKLLQIIISGQREIEGILRQPEMKPVSQRIAIRLRTSPLRPTETFQYIAHRLRVAGGDVKTIFTPAAIKAVSWSSTGIPRLINLICEHALISGYADNQKPVRAETIWGVAKEFGLGVATWGEETRADEVFAAIEAGALTQPVAGITEKVSAQPTPAMPPAEVPKPLRPPIPPATQAPSAAPRVTAPAPAAIHPPGEVPGTPSAGGSAPKGSPAGRPVIPPKPAAGAPGSAEDTDAEPRETSQPRLLKQVAVGRGFPNIYTMPPKPALERPASPLWATLALILLVVVLAGYYLLGDRLLMKIRRSELPNSRSQSTTLGKSPSDTLAGPHAPGPSGTTGLAVQEPTPTPSAPSVPTGKVEQVPATPAESAREELPPASPRPPPRLKPERTEAQVIPKPAAREATVPPPPPPLGRLAVATNVPGATITLDGQSDPHWTTPHLFTKLSPGAHSIVVSKQGYNEAQRSVTVEAGREASLSVTLASARGEIDISTRPPGAEVLIDGKSYGPGPVQADVDAGEHTFLVRQAGRDPVEGKLVVQAQAVVQRTIDLPPKPQAPPAMNVAITTNPTAATVYVDGAPISGRTPLSLHLTTGHHILILFAEGYRPVRREVDVPQEGTLTVNETLTGQ
jgi:type II secretory pathway predicted ATPase ExeA